MVERSNMLVFHVIDIIVNIPNKYTQYDLLDTEGYIGALQ